MTDVRCDTHGLFITEAVIRVDPHGDGSVVPICGEIMHMPGLPEIPAAEGMDIDANGVISGFS